MKHHDSTQLQQDLRALMDSGALFERALGHANNYLQTVHDRNVAPSPQAQAALEVFRQPLPDGPGDAAALIDQLAEIGAPGTVAQVGGRFFGLVNGSVLPTSLAARLVAGAWDQNAVLHATSPVNAVLEEVCEAWLIDLLGLPASTVAGFVSGTSMAIVCGLAAARWRLCQRAGYDFNKLGWRDAPALRIVTGRHTHSTVLKAIALLGFGTAQVELVDVDAQGRIRLDALPELDDKTILILQAGNVNSGAFDPLRPLCEATAAAGAWVHVDGAFGLWAAACKDLRHLADGLELAQSWSVDAHKTLNAPYDSGIFLCADGEAAAQALQNSAPYIMTSGHRDGMTYTPEMSRRARAVDLWGALKYLGRQGVDEIVTTLHLRARQFAEELTAESFEVVNDVVFNQVIVRVGDQATTDDMIADICSSGEAWVGGSRWFDTPIIRISVCSWATTAKDVTRTVKAFSAARRRISQMPPSG